MVFSSISFLIYFLPVVICLYYLAPSGVRNVVLLVTSLFFYAWGEPIYVFLMLFSIVFNYCFGILLDKFIKAESQMIKPKAIIAINIVVNLGILGFFKYADFFVSNVNFLLGTNISATELPLPIGISFYTFQAMSYIVDLYRRKVQVQKNIINFGTYVALFPQLIAGPIVRFNSIEKQLVKRNVNMEMFASGVQRFVIGMGKKVLLANNIGLLWENVINTNSAEMSICTAWLGAIAFTLQIYFDFSGYSDMAIGLGKMFGFHFLENFDYPYMSKSITEFWRRWHISLGSWFKEYVYIPLGGNRHGIKRQMTNIFIVWALTGLWHGASWNFIIWGIYFAILLVIEKLILGSVLKKLQERYRVLGTVIVHIYTMLLVTISWVIFAVDDLSLIKAYMTSLIGLQNIDIINSYTGYLLSGNWILIVICTIGVTNVPIKLWRKIKNDMLQEKLLVRAIVENLGLLLLLIVSIGYIVASTYNPFLYFRF